jgi:hypothetical protein
MADSKKIQYAAISAAIALSSLAMLWLLWRFPIPTCIASVVVLGCSLHCTRIARSIDLALGPIDPTDS